MKSGGVWQWVPHAAGVFVGEGAIAMTSYTRAATTPCREQQGAACDQRTGRLGQDGEARGRRVGAPIAVVVLIADLPGVVVAGEQLAGGDGQSKQIGRGRTGVEDERAALEDLPLGRDVRA